MRQRLLVMAALAALSLPTHVWAQTPPAAKAEQADQDEQAEKSGKDEKAGKGDKPGQKPSGTTAPGQKIKVGAYIQNITKFDLPLGKYNVDMIVEFTGPEGAKLEPQEFDVLNGEIEKDATGKIKRTEIPETDEPNVRRYKVSAEIAVDLDFRRYPFDVQDLSISIYDPEKTTKQQVYVSDGDVIEREAKAKIPGFLLSEPAKGEVHEESFDNANEKYSIYTIPLTMQRATLSAFMKTFMPVMVMVLISLLALVMGGGAAAGRFGAVTGTLLGAAMFHLATTSSLPPIGYVTLADKVFIAVYFSFLTNLLFTVVLLRKNDLKEEAAVKMIYNTARIAVPAATAAFVAIATMI